MSPANTTPELSDDDGRPGSSLGGLRGAGAARRRSTRACDQCRRTKSKCEPSDMDNMCRACATLGIPCTYAGPSHKRGPPKGYILALERRLHQVEALLGTIISSDDARARSLIDDLSRDQLAAHIIRRVKVGPFGPRGRLQQPFGSTKEDFLAAIMTGSGDDSPSRSHFQEENLALISPDRDWQDRLQTLLSSTRQGSAPQYAQAPGPYALPSLRQLASPAPQGQPMMGGGGGLPVSYPAKMESPVSSSALLAPLSTYPSGGGYGRMWDAGSSGGGGGGGGFGGLQRPSFSDEGLLQRPDQDVKGNYELASPPPSQPMNGRDSYRNIQRAQQSNATPPQWYFTQEAVS